ncbi:MAG: Flp family type IVb pilin [Nitriliruptoraceae bacterium]
MNALRSRIRSISTRAVRDQEGASAVEYGLLVGLIALGIILAVTLLGDNLAAMFTDIANAL